MVVLDQKINKIEHSWKREKKTICLNSRFFCYSTDFIRKATQKWFHDFLCWIIVIKLSKLSENWDLQSIGLYIIWYSQLVATAQTDFVVAEITYHILQTAGVLLYFRVERLHFLLLPLLFYRKGDMKEKNPDTYHDSHMGSFLWGNGRLGFLQKVEYLCQQWFQRVSHQYGS